MTEISIVQRLRTVHNQVTIAITQLMADAVIDLTQTQRAITEICTAIDALPKAERVAYEKGLIALLDDTERLYQLLQTKLQETEQKIKSLQPGQKAAHAYGKAATIKPDNDA